MLEKLLLTCDDQSMAATLHCLLTDKEQKELHNRLAIFRLLEKGIPQREIAERLSVGIATVSRGAKAFNQGLPDNILAFLRSLND